MSQKSKNERLTEETPETSIVNMHNDLERKGCEDIGKLKHNLTGQKFGRWNVLEFSHRDKSSANFWKCECECDNKIRLVREKTLVTGKSKSCGCYRDSELSKRATKHGYCGTRTYKSYESMKNRCLNPNATDFHIWGGKGIKICKRWLGENGFNHFLEDMGERPENTTIDRIDSNLHYSCGKCEECIKNGWEMNCRWETDEIQGRNTKRCKKITYNGQTRGLREWAKHAGMSWDQLKWRLKNGWSFEEAINTPKKEDYVKETHITYNGKTKRLFEWAKETGIPRRTITSRLNRGWSVEKSLTEPVRK